MDVCTDPICEACGEEEETSLHFLGQCNDNMQPRFSALDAYLLNLAELQNCKLADLLSPPRGCYNLWYIRFAQWTNSMASALSGLTTALPEVKVRKGKDVPGVSQLNARVANCPRTSRISASMSRVHTCMPGPQNIPYFGHSHTLAFLLLRFALNSKLTRQS